MSGYPPIHVNQHVWFYRIGDKLEFVVETPVVGMPVAQFAISYKQLRQALANSRPTSRHR